MTMTEFEAAVATAVRKAMAAEARRAGQRRHHRFRNRAFDLRGAWNRRGPCA